MRRWPLCCVGTRTFRIQFKGYFHFEDHFETGATLSNWNHKFQFKFTFWHLAKNKQDANTLHGTYKSRFWHFKQITLSLAKNLIVFWQQQALHTMAFTPTHTSPTLMHFRVCSRIITCFLALNLIKQNALTLMRSWNWSKSRSCFFYI